MNNFQAIICIDYFNKQPRTSQLQKQLIVVFNCIAIIRIVLNILV